MIQESDFEDRQILRDEEQYLDKQQSPIQQYDDGVLSSFQAMQ
jgi:hypothetical protein